jgi:hypothetical protein
LFPVAAKKDSDGSMARAITAPQQIPAASSNAVPDINFLQQVAADARTQAEAVIQATADTHRQTMEVNRQIQAVTEQLQRAQAVFQQQQQQVASRHLAQPSLR